MKKLETRIEELMQEVAQADGYSNFYNIDTELQSEYICRAYWKVIEERYSFEEMCLNMQYYYEYTTLKEYVTPMEWIEKHKHF